jgi:hypothetical protein
MNLDFDQSAAPSNPQVTVIPSSGVWDQSKWDQVTWATEIIPFARWQMATGMGHYGAFRVKTSSSAADVRYYATDYVFEAGGVL